jgi:hypothetical protein
MQADDHPASSFQGAIPALLEALGLPCFGRDCLILQGSGAESIEGFPDRATTGITNKPSRGSGTLSAWYLLHQFTPTCRYIDEPQFRIPLATIFSHSDILCSLTGLVNRIFGL